MNITATHKACANEVRIEIMNRLYLPNYVERPYYEIIAEYFPDKAPETTKGD